jgi:hypothetical protein
MPKRNDGKAALHVPGIRPRDIRQALREASLVRAHDFHALPEDHEGFVDVPCFFEPVAGGVGVFCPFGTC